MNLVDHQNVAIAAAALSILRNICEDTSSRYTRRALCGVDLWGNTRAERAMGKIAHPGRLRVVCCLGGRVGCWMTKCTTRWRL